MPGTLTEGQYRTSKQQIQNRFVRIALLNDSYQTVDELSGNAISGSFTIDSNADIRRTGSIQLVITDSSFEVEEGGRIWLDKYVQIFVGNVNSLSNQIEWNNIGIFIIDAPNYKYDATNNTLSLSLLDLMAKMDGSRNGYLEGIPVEFKADENIRSAIISTLTELGGFKKYIVEEAPSPGTIPNDIKFGQGSTVYSLLKGLKDIYPNYEIFFDKEGVFHYQPIPTGKNEVVFFNDDLWDGIVTSEEVNVDFQNVKNYIEVYGRTHDPAGFSTQTTISGTTLQLQIASITALVEDYIYGFVAPSITAPVNCDKLQINSLGVKDLKTESGKIPTVEKDVYYCVRYKNNAFVWLGHLQAYGLAKDTNPDSPFDINGSIGIIRLPLFDGEYSNCLTDELAQQRADYELYLHARMNDSINLIAVPAYFLDVNILVEYSKRGSLFIDQYLIKTINFGIGPSDTMTINMIKYYPEPTPPTI